LFSDSQSTMSQALLDDFSLSAPNRSHNSDDGQPSSSSKPTAQKKPSAVLTTAKNMRRKGEAILAKKTEG